MSHSASTAPRGQITQPSSPVDGHKDHEGGPPSEGPPTAGAAAGLYLGTFLVASATLAIEVSFTRLLSVVTWYYLAFFSISIAMVGMTAAALTVHFAKEWFRGERMGVHLGRAALLLAVLTPASLVLVCLHPFKVLDESSGVMFVASLLTLSVLAMVPFYLSGLVIAAAVTRSGLPTGKIYAADLVGAASGCLVSLLGLHLTDPMSMILVASVMAAVAAVIIPGPGQQPGRKSALAAAAALGLLTLLNITAHAGLRPVIVKGLPEKADTFMETHWNSHSRVTLERPTKNAQFLWGAGRGAGKPHPESEVIRIRIDAGAGTFMQRMGKREHVLFLEYDVSNVGHVIAPRERACIIGFGAGRDIQSASLYDYKNILGIELNKILYDLVRGEWAEYTGIGAMSNVTLINDEARSYLEESDLRCSWLQMSLIDTWAATAAGAMSLSENGLYTLEALNLFMDRLTPGGIISISRFHGPETMRLLAMFMEVMLARGVEDPARQIVLIKAQDVITLLVSQRPFSPAQLDKLSAVSGQRGFTPLHVPGRVAPGKGPGHAILKARSPKHLAVLYAASPYDLSPSTDDRPYFFNMLRPSHFTEMGVGLKAQPTLQGNLIAARYLFALMKILLLLALATVAIPLLLSRRQGLIKNMGWGRFLAGITYFGLIGLGFMFVEMALVQRFSAYLGHPIHALALVLSTIIFATGMGSLISERIPLARKNLLKSIPLVIALVTLASSNLSALIVAETHQYGLLTRAAITVLLQFPLGLLMGLCFPLGMRMLREEEEALKPWFWGINGIMSVLASGSAVVVSLYLGISASFILGACCYTILSLTVFVLLREGISRSGAG